MLEAKSMENIEKSAQYIRDTIVDKVSTAIILGRVPSTLLDKLEDKIEIAYR